MKNQKNWIVAGLALVGGYLLLKKPQTPTAGLMGAGMAMTRNLGEIIESARKIVRDLGSSVDQAARLAGVPRWLVLAIASYEIRNFPYNKVNPAVGATGVMQITPVTAVDALYFADKYNLLTPAVVAVLQKYISPKNWPVVMKYARDRSAKGKTFFTAALKQPEFNLMMGSLILRAGLIQHPNTDGQPNLAKVVLQYNQGFSFGKKLSRPGLVNASDQLVLSSAPSSEGRSYVSNMMADGGVIETMRSQDI